jgi:hypothetical protein
VKIRAIDVTPDTDEVWIALEIRNEPSPPEIDEIESQRVMPGGSLNLTIVSIDPDDDTASMSCENMPDNSSFGDYCDGTGWFDFYPTESEIGTYDVSFIAFDGELADTMIVQITVADYVCGDVDASQEVDIDDVVYLIAYIFSGGPEPVPYESGDVNCSTGVDIDDVVYMIAYIFSGGPPPCDTNDDGTPEC